MSFRRCKYLVQQANERFIRWIVGPQAKDTAGMQRGRQGSKARVGIERAIARIQPVAGRMINIEQHGVKQTAWVIRV
ncbi:MAG: hypothetical protein GY886_08880, partial [Gammaproteobacteria bacterium]|nr:hypothetical protein [Gammaproteobacteria bacterium]